MTLIYLYKYLNNILTKKICYNAAYSFSCSNISFNREKTALQHSKHNEMSVKVTKQAMKMCHLYHRFCKTDLETTEVSISTLLDRNRNASFLQILKIHCRLQTVFRHQTFTSLVDLHRISPSHLCYLYHTMIHM